MDFQYSIFNDQAAIKNNSLYSLLSIEMLVSPHKRRNLHIHCVGLIVLGFWVKCSTGHWAPGLGVGHQSVVINSGHHTGDNTGPCLPMMSGLLSQHRPH